MPTLRYLIASSFAAGVLAAQTPSAPTVTVLHAAKLWDGTGAAPITDAVVVVTGDHITAVGPASKVTVPAGAQRVELGTATLVPGFIDAHVHLTGRPLSDPGADAETVKDYDSYGA